MCHIYSFTVLMAEVNYLYITKVFESKKDP